MIEYFQKAFALSLQGAKDLKIAIIWHTALNISFSLPIILAFIFLDDYMKVLLQGAEARFGIIFYVGFGILFLLIMYAISHIDYQKTFTKIYNESANRRIGLAETLRKLPLAFFGQKDIADLSSTIMEDVNQIEQLFSHTVPQIFASLVSMAIFAFFTFLYNVPMSIALFWVVPVGFFVFFLSKNMIEKSNTKVYQARREISDVIQEGLENVAEIKSYSQEKNYLKNLHAKLSEYEQILIKSELIGGVFLNISHFILKLGFPSVIFAGAYLLSHEQIDIFTYLVFLILVGRVYDPFTDAMNNFGALLYLNVRIKRMKEMDNMPVQTGKTEFSPQNFDIEFKNVNFSYQKDIQTLQNISFTAKQGEVTALIGPSGGGKSTTAKLAARFWDIEGGVISIGGEDISQIEPESLLRYFSIVFQDVTLFNGSVLENIRLGKKNANDEEVKNAAKLAMCDEFVQNLPQGYDTLIGENGERLSGGERQRISIARALLKDAPIILLDEATASLDAQNESKIQKAISELIKNKTVLVIAHRMRTVANADKIVAIKQGEVMEMGAPKELEEKEGIFASMVKRQEF